MGCCVSSDQKDDSSGNNSAAPPPSVVEEETIVKEVLSETTLLTNDNSTEETTIKTSEEDEEKKPSVVDVAPEPVKIEPGSVDPKKGSEASEVCSLSKSLLSIVNECNEEEAKLMKSQEVRQRSPAKSRNRVMARKTDMSPCRRNTGGEGAGLVTERSERRSRSPAMNKSMTRSQSSTESGGALAVRKQSQSPGRVRLIPNKNGLEQDCHHHHHHHQWPSYNSTPNDSFENPLVSLECFIFL